jgi:UDP-N-acetyl-D-mannosaminuronic acid dehydrogenase
MPGMMDLLERIERRKARVAVLGLGYVGLPTAALIANEGFRVVGLDLKKCVVTGVNSGRIEVREPGLAELVRRTVDRGLLRATTSPDNALAESDIILIVVQTPLQEDKSPNLEPLKKACEEVAEHLGKKRMVIIESTIPPGAMEELVKPVLESRGLRAGSDFYLAYSPERAMPTRTLIEIRENPRIIGGLNRESAEAAKEFYKTFVEGELFLEDLGTVEVVKLIENTYRDVNIALANEIARLCEVLGVDAIRAIELANRHPRVCIHRPGAGVGGHCIPKDPYFLLHKAASLGIQLQVIEAARRINDSMPLHVVSLIEKALESVNKRLEDSKVAVLGVAYKGDTDDVRGTPARDIIKKLMVSKASVFSHDPFVKQDFGGRFSNNLEKVLKHSDCVVVVTDHSLYKTLNPKDLARNLGTQCVLVDARRILKPGEFEEQGFGYFGVGYRGA